MGKTIRKSDEVSRNNSAGGFSMRTDYKVRREPAVRKEDYGRIMTDSYGRTYVQTPHGKIY